MLTELLRPEKLPISSAVLLYNMGLINSPDVMSQED